MSALKYRLVLFRQQETPGDAGHVAQAEQQLLPMLGASSKAALVDSIVEIQYWFCQVTAAVGSVHAHMHAVTAATPAQKLTCSAALACCITAACHIPMLSDTMRHSWQVSTGLSTPLYFQHRV